MRPLITTDSHLVPPLWLTDQLPARWRDQFPRVEERADGRYIVAPVSSAGQLMMSGAKAAEVRLAGDEDVGRASQSNVCDEAHFALDPVGRLADMDREGVIGAVLIDNATVTPDGVSPEAEIAWCRIVNDWMADTYGSHLDRFAPGIHLPLQDVDAAVRELERAAAMGLRPAVLPDALGDRPYNYPEWEPLWEAGSSLGVPFTMHVGGTRFGREPPPQVDPLRSTMPGASQIKWYLLCTGMGETIAWFTLSGLFQKYPGLTIVMTEGYAGWLAFAMQFLDHHWDSRWGARMRARGYHVRMPEGAQGAWPAVDLDEPPSHYIKRQAKATFMWDPVAVASRHSTGLDCLMWGNDYPHFEGSFPDSQAWIDKQFAGVPEAEIDQIVRANAARVFRLGGAVPAEPTAPGQV